MEFRETEQIARAIDEATAGMPAEQLGRSPAEGKWSPAQTLEHLSLAFGSTARVMRKLVTSGDGEAVRPNARQRLAAFVVTGLGYLPSGRKAPPFTVPSGLAPEEALRQIRANLAEMDAALASAEQRFGNRLRVEHPLIGPMTLKQWRRFHWVHTQHHMRQIASLRARS